MDQSKYHSRFYQSSMTRVKIKLKASPFNAKIRLFAMAKSPEDVIKGIRPKTNTRQYKSKKPPAIEDISSISNAFSHLHNDIESLLDKNTEEAKDAEMHDSELFKALLPLSQKYSRSQFFNDKIKKDNNDLQRNLSSNDLFSNRKKRPRKRFTYEDDMERSFVPPKPRHFSPNARYKPIIALKPTSSKTRRNSSTIRNSLPVISLNQHSRSFSVSDFNPKHSNSPPSSKIILINDQNQNKNIQNVRDAYIAKDNNIISNNSKKLNEKQKTQNKAKEALPDENNQSSSEKKVSFEINENNQNAEKVPKAKGNQQKSPNSRVSPSKNQKGQKSDSPKNANDNLTFPKDNKQSSQRESTLKVPLSKDNNKQQTEISENTKINGEHSMNKETNELKDPFSKENNNNSVENISFQNEQDNKNLLSNENKKEDSKENGLSTPQINGKSASNQNNQKEFPENAKFNDENSPIIKNHQKLTSKEIDINQNVEKSNEIKNDDLSQIPEPKEEEKIDALNMTEFNDSCFFENDVSLSSLFVYHPYSNFQSDNAKTKTNNKNNDIDKNNNNNNNELGSKQNVENKKSYPFDDDNLLKTDFNTINFISDTKDQLFKQESFSKGSNLLNTEFKTINFTSEDKQQINSFVTESFNVNGQSIKFINKTANSKVKKNPSKIAKSSTKGKFDSYVNQSSSKNENDKEIAFNNDENLNLFNDENRNLIKFDQTLHLDDSSTNADGYEKDQINSYNLTLNNILLIQQNEFITPKEIDQRDLLYSNSLNEIDSKNKEMTTIPTYFNALQIQDFSNKMSENENDEQIEKENGQYNNNSDNDDENLKNYLFQDRSANLLLGNPLQVLGLSKDFGDSVETNVNEISLLDENSAKQNIGEIGNFDYSIPAVNDSIFLPLTLLSKLNPMISEENSLSQSSTSFQIQKDDLNNKYDFRVSCQECEKEKQSSNIFTVPTSQSANKATSFSSQSNIPDYKIQPQERSFVDLIQTASRLIDKSYNDDEFENKQEAKFVDHQFNNDFKLPKSSKFVDNFNYNDEFKLQSSDNLIRNDDFRIPDTQFADHTCQKDFELQKLAKIMQADRFNSDNFTCKQASEFIPTNDYFNDYKLQETTGFVDTSFDRNEFDINSTNQVIGEDRFNDIFTCQEASEQININLLNEDFELQDQNNFTGNAFNSNDFEIRELNKNIEKDRFNDGFMCQNATEQININLLNKDFELQKPNNFIDNSISLNDFETKTTSKIIPKDLYNDNFTCKQAYDTANDSNDKFECHQSSKISKGDWMQICKQESVKDDYKLADETMFIICDDQVDKESKDSFIIKNDQENNKPTEFLASESDYHEDLNLHSLISEPNEKSALISKNTNNYTESTQFYVVNNDDYQYNDFENINETEYDKFLPTMNDKCLGTLSFLSSPIPDEFGEKQVPDLSKSNVQVTNEEDFNLNSFKEENNQVYNTNDFNLNTNDKLVSVIDKSSFILTPAEGIDKPFNTTNEFRVFDVSSYKEKHESFTINDPSFDLSKTNDMKIREISNYKDGNYLLNDKFFVKSDLDPIISKSNFASEVNEESFKNNPKKDEFYIHYDASSFSPNPCEFNLSFDASFKEQKVDNTACTFSCDDIPDPECYKVKSLNETPNSVADNYVDNQSFGEFLTIQSSDKLFVLEINMINNSYNNNDYSIPNSFYNIAHMIENRCMNNDSENLFRLPAVNDTHVEIPTIKSEAEIESKEPIKPSFSSIDSSSNNSKLPKENKFNDVTVDKLNNKLTQKSPIISKGKYKDDKNSNQFNTGKTTYKEPKDSKLLLKPDNYSNQSSLVVDKKDKYEVKKYNEMTSFVDNKSYKDSKSSRHVVNPNNYKDSKGPKLVSKPSNYSNNFSLIIDENDMHFVIKCNEMSCIIDNKNYKDSKASRLALKQSNYTNKGSLVADKNNKYKAQDDEMKSISSEPNKYKDTKASRNMLKENNYKDLSPSKNTLKPVEYKDSDNLNHVIQANNYKDLSKSKKVVNPNDYTNSSDSKRDTKTNNYKDSSKSKKVVSPSDYTNSSDSKRDTKTNNYKDSSKSKKVVNTDDYINSSDPKRDTKTNNYKVSADSKRSLKPDSYKDSSGTKNVMNANNYKDSIQSKNSISPNKYKDSDNIKHDSKSNNYKVSNDPKRSLVQDNYTNSSGSKDIMNVKGYKESNNQNHLVKTDNYKDPSNSKDVKANSYKDSSISNLSIKPNSYKESPNSKNVSNANNYKDSVHLKNVITPNKYKDSSNIKSDMKNNKYKVSNDSKRTLKPNNYKDSNNSKDFINDDIYKGSVSSKDISNDDNYKDPVHSKNTVNPNKYRDSSDIKSNIKNNNYKVSNDSKRTLKPNNYKDSNISKDVKNDNIYKDSVSSKDVSNAENYTDSIQSNNAINPDNYTDAIDSKDVTNQNNYKDSTDFNYSLKQNNYTDLHNSKHSVKQNNYRDSSSISADDNDTYLINSYNEMTCLTSNNSYKVSNRSKNVVHQNNYRDLTPSNKTSRPNNYSESSSFIVDENDKNMFNRYNEMTCFIDRTNYFCNHNTPSLPTSFTCSFSLLDMTEIPEDNNNNNSSIIQESNFETQNTEDLMSTSDFSSLSILDRSFTMFDNYNNNDQNQPESFDSFALKLPTNNDKQFGEIVFKYQSYSPFTNQTISPKVKEEEPGSSVSRSLTNRNEQNDFFAHNQNASIVNNDFTNMEFSLDPNEFRSVSVFCILKEGEESRKVDQPPVQLPAMIPDKCFVENAEFNLLSNVPGSYRSIYESPFDSTHEKDNEEEKDDNFQLAQPNYVQKLREFTLPETNYVQESGEFALPKTNHVQKSQEFDLPETNYVQKLHKFALPGTNYAQESREIALPETNYIQESLEFTLPETNYVQKLHKFALPGTNYAQKSREIALPETNYIQESGEFDLPETSYVNQETAKCDVKLSVINESSSFKQRFTDPLSSSCQFNVDQQQYSTQNMSPISLGAMNGALPIMGDFQCNNPIIVDRGFDADAESAYFEEEEEELDESNESSEISNSFIINKRKEERENKRFQTSLPTINDSMFTLTFICPRGKFICDDRKEERPTLEETKAKEDESSIEKIPSEFDLFLPVMNDSPFDSISFLNPMKSMQVLDNTTSNVIKSMPNLTINPIIDDILINETEFKVSNIDDLQDLEDVFYYQASEYHVKENTCEFDSIKYCVDPSLLNMLPSLLGLSVKNESSTTFILSAKDKGSELNLCDLSSSSMICRSVFSLNAENENKTNQEESAELEENEDDSIKRSIESGTMLSDKVFGPLKFECLTNRMKSELSSKSKKEINDEKENEKLETSFDMPTFVPFDVSKSINLNNARSKNKKNQFIEEVFDQNEFLVYSPMNVSNVKSSDFSAAQSKLQNPDKSVCSPSYFDLCQEKIRNKDTNNFNINFAPNANHLSTVSSFVANPMQARISPNAKFVSEKDQTEKAKDKLSSEEQFSNKNNEMKLDSTKESMKIDSEDQFSNRKDERSVSLLSFEHFKSPTSSYIDTNQDQVIRINLAANNNNNNNNNEVGFNVKNYTFTLSTLYSNDSRISIDDQSSVNPDESIKNLSTSFDENAITDKLVFGNGSGSPYKCPSDLFANVFKAQSASALSKSLNLSSSIENNLSPIEGETNTSITYRNISFESYQTQEFFTISSVFPEKPSIIIDEISNQSFGLLNISSNFIVNQKDRQQESKESLQKTIINASSVLVSNSMYNVSNPASPVYSQLDEFKPYVIPRDPDKELVKGRRRAHDPNFEKFDVTIFGKNHAFISYLNDKDKDEDENKTTKIDSSFVNLPLQQLKGPAPRIKPPVLFKSDPVIDFENEEADKETENDDNNKVDTRKRRSGQKESKDSVNNDQKEDAEAKNKDMQLKNQQEELLEEEEEILDENQEIVDNSQAAKKGDNQKGNEIESIVENEYNYESEALNSISSSNYNKKGKDRNNAVAGNGVTNENASEINLLSEETESSNDATAEHAKKSPRLNKQNERLPDIEKVEMESQQSAAFKDEKENNQQDQQSPVASPTSEQKQNVNNEDEIVQKVPMTKSPNQEEAENEELDQNKQPNDENEISKEDQERQQNDAQESEGKQHKDENENELSEDEEKKEKDEIENPQENEEKTQIENDEIESQKADRENTEQKQIEKDENENQQQDEEKTQNDNDEDKLHKEANQQVQNSENEIPIENGEKQLKDNLENELLKKDEEEQKANHENQLLSESDEHNHSQNELPSGKENENASTELPKDEKDQLQAQKDKEEAHENTREISNLTPESKLQNPEETAQVEGEQQLPAETESKEAESNKENEEKQDQILASDKVNINDEYNQNEMLSENSEYSQKDEVNTARRRRRTRRKQDKDLNENPAEQEVDEIKLPKEGEEEEKLQKENQEKEQQQQQPQITISKDQQQPNENGENKESNLEAPSQPAKSDAEESQHISPKQEQVKSEYEENYSENEGGTPDQQASKDGSQKPRRKRRTQRRRFKDSNIFSPEKNDNENEDISNIQKETDETKPNSANLSPATKLHSPESSPKDKNDEESQQQVSLKSTPKQEQAKSEYESNYSENEGGSPDKLHQNEEQKPRRKRRSQRKSAKDANMFTSDQESSKKENPIENQGIQNVKEDENSQQEEQIRSEGADETDNENKEQIESTPKKEQVKSENDEEENQKPRRKRRVPKRRFKDSIVFTPEKSDNENEDNSNVASQNEADEKKPNIANDLSPTSKLQQAKKTPKNNNKNDEIIQQLSFKSTPKQDKVKAENEEADNNNNNYSEPESGSPDQQQKQQLQQKDDNNKPRRKHKSQKRRLKDSNIFEPDENVNPNDERDNNERDKVEAEVEDDDEQEKMKPKRKKKNQRKKFKDSNFFAQEENDNEKPTEDEIKQQNNEQEEAGGNSEDEIDIEQETVDQTVSNDQVKIRKKKKNIRIVKKHRKPQENDAESKDEESKSQQQEQPEEEAKKNRPKKKKKSSTMKPNEQEEGQPNDDRYQSLLQTLEDDLPNYTVNEIAGAKRDPKSFSREVYLNLELFRKSANEADNKNANTNMNVSQHLEVPTVHHTKPAPPLPLPIIPANSNGNENKAAAAANNDNDEDEEVEQLEYDEDHNLITVVLKSKNVKFRKGEADSTSDLSRQTWPDLQVDYYQRNRRRGPRSGRRRQGGKKDAQEESTVDSLHNFIMSPLHNLQLMSPNRSEHFMRQLSTNDFQTATTAPLTSHHIDYTVFFESIIFPISLQNDEVASLVKPSMTFDECLSLSEQFIDDHLNPLKSSSVVFHQDLDKKGEFFDISLNGLIQTKNNVFEPVPVNEVTYKVVQKTAKSKAKPKTATVRVNVGNEKYLIETADSDTLTSLLDNEYFGVLSVLKKSEIQYADKNRQITSPHNINMNTSPHISDDVIISPNLLISITLLNSPHFPLKLVKMLFDSMIVAKYHIYITRALFLAEAANVPSHLIFKRSSRFSRPLMLIFIAYGIKWIRQLVSSLVKVRKIDISRFLKLLLKSVAKMPEESFFVVRTIVTLSFFTVGNGKSVFFVFLSFLSRVIREVVKVTKNEGVVDENGRMMTSSQVIETVQILFSDLLAQLENMDKKRDASFEILIPFLSEILNKTPVLNEKKKRFELDEVRSFIEGNQKEIEFDMMKFVDQPKSKNLLAYSFAFNFQFLSELID